MLLRSTISIAVLAGAVGAFAAGPVTGQAGQPADFHAAALDRDAGSRVEGDLAMDDAVAASLVGAIALQFPRHKVEVRLDKVSVAPLSLRDRAVSGEGRVRIGADEAWIPLAFQALYDTRDTIVTRPRLVFGSDAPSRMLPPRSALLHALSQQVGRALADEFGQQPAKVHIAHASTSPAGQRYLHVEGVGQVSFEGEGSEQARFHALYDRTTGQWLRVSYDLGPGLAHGEMDRG